jgi:hypothetical protein
MAGFPPIPFMMNKILAKLPRFAVLSIALLGASAATYVGLHLASDCCAQGAACCKPGAACCSHNAH